MDMENHVVEEPTTMYAQGGIEKTKEMVLCKSEETP